MLSGYVHLIIGSFFPFSDPRSDVLFSRVLVPGASAGEFILYSADVAARPAQLLRQL